MATKLLDRPRDRTEKTPIPKIAWFVNDTYLCSLWVNLPFHTHFAAKRFVLTPPLEGVSRVMAARIANSDDPAILLVPSEPPESDIAWDRVCSHPTENYDDVFESLDYKLIWWRCGGQS